MFVIGNFLNNGFIHNSPSIISIGKFGVFHKGHELLLNTLKKESQIHNLYPIVFSFSPSPTYFFLRDKNYLPLFSLRKKKELLHNFFSNEDCYTFLVQKFNSDFASLTGENFIKFLRERMNVKIIIVGEDFCFGRKRESNITDLENFGRKYNFDVIKQPLSKEEDKIITTSSLRESLKNGDIKTLNDALAFDAKYSISGRVIVGAGMAGKILGFKTANISLHANLSLPKFGVYSASVMFKNRLYNAIANIGIKPTVNVAFPLLEVHLFDFNGNLYGEKLEVFLNYFIREERKFASLEVLKDQIKEDVKSLS